MGIAGTLASGISLVISWSGVMNKFSGRNAALLLILVNIGLFFLMAFTWWIIIGGLSALLLFGTVGAAMIGNLGFLILLPWVSANFPPTSTNALLSGSSLASLICVVIQLVQSPGTSNSLFSPTIYFVILTLPSFLSIRCIFLVQRAAEAKEGSRNVERTCMSICPSWYRQKVFKHTFISVWTSMLSWWTVLIILPYASAVTDPEWHLGSEVLQWATALGIFGLLLGNVLSSFVGNDRNFHLVPITLIMTLLEVVVFLAMFDIPGGGF